MKTMDLCVPCSIKLRETSSVRKVAGGVDHKVNCGCCGRRRFGGTYQVTTKAEVGA